MTPRVTAPLIIALLVASLTLQACAETVEGLQLTGTESKLIEGGEVTFTAPVTLAGRSSLTIRGATLRFASTDSLLTVTENATLTLSDVKLTAGQTKIRAKDESTVTLEGIRGVVSIGLSQDSRLRADAVTFNWIRGADAAACTLRNCTVEEYSLVSQEASRVEETTIRVLSLLYIDGSVNITAPVQGTHAAWSTDEITGDAVPLTRLNATRSTVESCKLTLSDGSLAVHGAALDEAALVGVVDADILDAKVKLIHIQGFQGTLTLRGSEVDTVRMILNDADLTTVDTAVQTINMQADGLLRFSAQGGAVGSLSLSTGGNPISTIVKAKSALIGELAVTDAAPRSILLEDSTVAKVTRQSPGSTTTIHLQGSANISDEATATPGVRAIRYSQITATFDGTPVEGAEAKVEAGGKTRWTGTTDKQGRTQPRATYALGPTGNTTASATLTVTSPRGSATAPLTLKTGKLEVKLTAAQQPIPLPAAAALLGVAAALLFARKRFNPPTPNNYHGV